MTEWLSRRMVECGIIKEEEQRIYEFGIRNGMILFLDIVTAFLIGLLTGKLAVVAVFTVSFMILRSYTGGYHSDSRLFCYIGSNLVLFVPVYTGVLFEETEKGILLLFLYLAVVIIFIFSPMHSKNRRLDEKEQKHFGRKARIVATAELLVFAVLSYAGENDYAYAVYTSLCITAVFMLIGKIQLQIQSHME